MNLNKDKCLVENHGLTVEWCYDRGDPNYPSGGMAVCQYVLWIRPLWGRWVRPPYKYRSLILFVDFVDRSENQEQIIAELFSEANTGT